MLNSVQDFAPAAAGFVQSVYQQASSYAGGAFNWAFECTNGVSFQPAGADTVEFEFVGGVPTTLNFKTANAPLAVRVVRKNNSAPIQSLTWTTVPVAAGTQMTMTFDNGAFQSLQDNQGTTYAPDLTRSENGSLDYSIPSLGYHLQEMSGWTNVVFDWTNDSPVTRTSNLVFIAEDINLNGTPLDDRWLPLTNYPPSLDLTNLLGRDPQLYAIVQNDAGNLSQPIKLEFAGDPAGAECRLFNLEKTKLLETVNEGITEALNLGFLLDRRHVALFEQGSGACLWATDPCITCSGAYTPGKSDHDLELFLPLVVDPTDPLHHEALTPANAFLPATLEGNWYHRGPTNPNGPAPYQYEVPPGFSPGGTLSWNGIPASGDLPAIVAQPDTPAQIIARIFDRLRHQPDVLAVLPDVSFFPERRDHFESGILHLNRPPNEGDDPLGDAGHGRQLLLLKWVLEGRWVTGFEGLSLDQVYANMQSQVFPSLNNSQNGIPAVEGFEWGRLQEHAALKSGILLRAVDMVDPAEPNPRAKNFLYDTFVGQVKKVGKGAMRAALAEIAGLAGPGITNLFISRAQYQSGNFKTFEDFVAAACSNQFIKLFSAPDLDLIGRSAKAKVADPVFIQQLLSDECAANRYLADALNFIRAVQTKTTPSFNDYMSFIQTNGMPGSAEQFAARTDNINFLYSGVTNPPSLSNLLHHAALDVVLRVFNLGPDPLPGTDLRMWIDGQERTNLSSDLDPFQVRYFKGQHYIAPPLGIQPFFVESDVDPASYGIPHTVDIVVSSSGRAPPGGGAPPGGTTAPFQTDWEPNSCNNWIRFRYYLFDPASPCPSIPFIVVPPPPNVHCTTSEICPGRRNLP